MNHSTNAYACWLRNAPINDDKRIEEYRGWARELVVPGPLSEVLQTAVAELMDGLDAMLGVRPLRSTASNGSACILIGVRGQLQDLDAELSWQDGSEDGYAIRNVSMDGQSRLVVAGHSAKGALYAVFHLLRLMQCGESLADLAITETPSNGLRMLNQWDNMDGSIERGYAGKSIFYQNNEIVRDMSRIRDYARLLASVGINAISINNVNVHSVESLLITDKLLSDVARVAGVFRRYGISTFLSINYASPMQLGGLTSADPLDESVRQWWKEKAEEIYRDIPDFGGFLVKADSEGRPGPFTYGRDHADGANMLAEVLQPFGGMVIWRCFVYNCQQDWRDSKTDRARAAFDHFTPLDGKFRDNVILQIKNGPMDFQVREPLSPLLGALSATNQVLELQITQEYTGQQRHLCYLIPQWKEVLDFDTFAHGSGSTVAQVASGQLFGRRLGGIAAVSNIGDNPNWTGHMLAQANLYGFGRLAWNPQLSAEQITLEWIYMTFGSDPDVVRIVSKMLLDSWRIYENYTAPLGVGWMVNPGHHYGPNVDGYEYSRWGTYHFADCHGIGVDRTIKSGTGYTSQYFAPRSEWYESREFCPDELLLFFHHVPYTHKLKTGKTVIQHIYDTHFDGVLQAEELAQIWSSIEGKIDPERFEDVRSRLREQAAHSKEWRDQINSYFFRKSGIPDENGRIIN
ncbi:alpha-glucuronidase family glycosyl hydrolase [Paenibacillus sp. Soil787]|uniref:alpha-glucuronidase family glycosyl hydrolase n=1 Tax=Paenibacillus sp. Soil787 TaxID=1736411 RepID=UPI0006F769DD|nr:alpha-glucuronidase family glycosyl hydrolase [Paenibacillus sp. Soil787]KRF42923.1 alpha-glucuronidase [Paenibacillus sp. Soil787]